MSVNPRYETFRPLRGGIAVVNPQVAQWATLGFIAADENASRWIVSCYHALARSDFSPFAGAEPVYQPRDHEGATPAAHVHSDRADAALDCAAAQLVDGIDAVAELLELGSVKPPIEPRVGMRVLKSGVKTGVTEGVVGAVNGDAVEIAVPPGFPPSYQLSLPGDSGALWVERDTLAAVALHKIGNDTGPEMARATRIAAVLAALRLTLPG